MILGVLEHLEVLLPLGVMGLAAEFAPKVHKPSVILLMFKIL